MIPREALEKLVEVLEYQDAPDWHFRPAREALQMLEPGDGGVVAAVLNEGSEGAYPLSPALAASSVAEPGARIGVYYQTFVVTRSGPGWQGGPK